jgi:spermidine synthase
MAASGFAGLGYQIIWTQQGALWLGHEAAAVFAVVTAFFGGLALGAATLGTRLAQSESPWRAYAICEASIAVWALIVAAAMPAASDALLAFIGPEPSPLRQWSVAFGGTFVLLLPATAAMGATLPLLQAALARSTQVAALYAANTFGAVAGVLAAALWLVPTLGLVRSSLVCAALNGGNALVAWLFARRALAPPPVATAGPPPRTQWMLAASGLLGIGYEVVAVRVLGQLTEQTVYTFALLLAVYLVGSAFGAAAYARWRTRLGDAPADTLLVALAAACALGAVGLWNAEALKPAGGSFGAALAAEAVIAAAAFALPTVVMGALFSHLAAGSGLGRALAANTLGAAAAPFVFGVMLLPAAGAKAALVAIVGGYLLLSAARRRPVVWVVAGSAAALTLMAPPLRFVDLPDGGRLVDYREGALAAVSVVEDANGVLTLHIDNRAQEGSSATRLVDGRQALLPLLLHAAPRHALFLGLGTGVTAATAAAEAGVEVDALELLPEVIAASRQFIGAPPPNLHLQAADVRRFVRAATQRYDVIVADNFHPARSGSGALYTVEHFEAVRERLADGGVFCQWLPLHQIDVETLRSVVRAFVAVHPQALALLASHSLQTPVLGLVAVRGGARFDSAVLRERLHRAPHEALGIDDELALLGSFVAGTQALAAFANGAPLNTDDRPVVAYRAPRATYEPEATPADRLFTLLAALHVEPADVLADGDTLAPRLAAYWAARDRYLQAGRDVRPLADPRAMLAQVQAPLLAVLRTSRDFRPAYEPLRRLAEAVALRDPAAAQALQRELAALQR